MEISAITLYGNHSINSLAFTKEKAQNYNNIYQQTPIDTFQKSNIAFTGKISQSKKEKVMDALVTTGFVGTAFLLTVGTAAALAKHQNPEDIFLSDGTYIGNVQDMSFKSDKLYVDADDGIFQAKAIGIDIRPDRFDYVDTKNGVYKNYSDGIDIDLSNNKYIDPENGIFIDPDNSITVLSDNNGILQNVSLPAFKGSSMSGGDCIGYVSNIKNMSRNEFIEKYGNTPETLIDNGYAHTYYNYITMPNGDNVLIDSRSFIKKILDFWKIDPDLCTEKYDYLGRRILHSGNKYNQVVDTQIQNILDKYHITGENDIAKATQILQESKLGDYIANNYPEQLNMLPKPSFEAFNDFIGQTGVSTTYNPDKLMNAFKDFTNQHAVSFTADAPMEQLASSVTQSSKNLVDSDVINSILSKLEENGEVVLNPNSYEALNFALFQEQLINNGDLAAPIIDWANLIDTDTISSALETLSHSGIADNMDSFIDAIQNVVESLI